MSKIDLFNFARVYLLLGRLRGRVWANKDLRNQVTELIDEMDNVLGFNEPLKSKAKGSL